jgi:hypothetical protein
VSFAAITICVASQRVFIVVYFVIDSVRKLLDTPLHTIFSVLENKQANEQFLNCVITTVF